MPIPVMPGTARSSRRSGGFTLIELLVAIAVIGILCALALPSYMAYVQRSYWASNITVVDALSRHAMVCQQTNGGSCSGQTGLVTPNDVDLPSWPTGPHIKDIGVVFSTDGTGYHIYMDSTPDSGGFHYSRGYSRTQAGTYIATQGALDAVPPSVIPQGDVNPAMALYHF